MSQPILTPDQLYIGRHIWCAYNYSDEPQHAVVIRSPVPIRYINLSYKDDDDFGEHLFFEVHNIDYGWIERWSCADRNITEHYNGHFIFPDEQSAKDYLSSLRNGLTSPARPDLHGSP